MSHSSWTYVGLLPGPVLQLLFGATGAPLLLAADFVTLLIVWGCCSTDLLFHTVGQETPGQEAVQPLRAATLHLDGEPRWPVEEAYAGRGFVDMLTAWPGRTDEGFLEILLVDLESLQACLKRALFLWTDTELAHLCIHRLHGDNITPQGIALPLSA
jgi:hypothetical protein